ncbi:PEP-CTERM sorting domain-containing protein [Elioraea thermophila]|uniref:PEP-CTERM sorting domain-containing protein n=1 Tax=Elioraea thermophila TaxID=2185104 RepID=UPI000DF13352|nr:PEP-CTERM sorting domain-containing protein [Elioraea thermophila]
MQAIRTLALAAFASAWSLSAQAALLDFTFTFSNRALGLSGTVTGIVRGLADNATSAAGSVEILSNTDGFGLGEYVGSPTNNTWTVAAGIITGYDFVVFGSFNTAPAVTCCTLYLNSLSVNGTALFDAPDGGAFSGTPKDILFARATTVVPEPASALLFAGALAAAALLRRRPTTA